MTNRSPLGRSRAARLWAVLLAAASVALLGAGVAHAKKGGGTFNATNAANLPIPVGTDASEGLATSTISAPKKFKGKRIRDVNVTLQITGTGGGAPGSLNPLLVTLTAPDGTTTILIGFGLDGDQAGPLTIDDESPFDLGAGTPVDSTLLYPPYAGAAQPDGHFFGISTLSAMDNGAVRGTWTLRVTDGSSPPFPAHTNTLTSWGLRVAAGSPFKTK